MTAAEPSPQRAHPAAVPRLVVAGLLVWALVWVGAYAVQGGSSWFFFEHGSRWLFDADRQVGGLDLYVGHPEIQIGPLSLLISAPFVAAGSAVGRWGAIVVMIGCGALVAAVLFRIALAVRGRIDFVAIACVAALAPVWSELAVGVAHLDDVLAMTFGTLAVWLMLGRQRAADRVRPLLAGLRGSVLVALLCAAAIDCKPWALGFAGLIAGLPRAHRLPALGALIGATCLAWAPFVLHDWATLHAMRFEIANSSFSALRALGVDSATTPSWCRPAQLVAGSVLGVLAGACGRPELVPAVVVGSRLLLDPGTHLYYNAGLVVATVLADVVVAPRRAPWFTQGALACVVVPNLVGRHALHRAPAIGDLRAAYLLVLLGACVWLCVRRPVRAS